MTAGSSRTRGCRVLGLQADALRRGVSVSETMAECVGDPPAVELLREFGIPSGQGFHLGRPEPLQLD